MKKKQSKVLIVMPSLSAEDREGMVFAQKLSEAACAAELEPIICGNAEQEAPSASGFRFIPCFSAKMPRIPFLLGHISRFMKNVNSEWFDDIPGPLWLVWLMCLSHSDFHFYAAFRRACRVACLKSGDKIFIPSITEKTFAIWVLCAAWASRELQTDVILYFDEIFSSKENSANNVAASLLEQIGIEGHCFPVAESANLACEYAVILAVPMRVYGPGGTTDVAILHSILRLEQYIRATSPPKAFLFYGLKNLHGFSSGSSLRLLLLMRYLEENGCEVLPFIPEQKFNLQNDKVVFYKAQEHFLDKVIFFVHKLQSKLSVSKYRDFFQFIAYTRKRGSRQFRLQMTQALITCNVAFVEHVLFLDIVTPLAKMAGVPIFATLYDDDSRRCYIPAIKNLVQRKIINRLGKVDCVATVESTECAMLRQHGIENFLIPSTADTQIFCADKYSNTVLSTQETTPNFLFVGSDYYPNLEAKKHIFSMAQKAKQRGLHWRFIIAGGCGIRDESIDNLIVTGVLNREDLLSAYTECTMIISPLTSGAGAAVKAIEGLGTGKPFIGTTITFRGLDVHDGRECIIEDDMEAYLDRIQAFLQAPDILLAIGERGKAFAALYDYRKIFTPYRDFIVEKHIL